MDTGWNKLLTKSSKLSVIIVKHLDTRRMPNRQLAAQYVVETEGSSFIGLVFTAKRDRPSSIDSET